MPSTLGLCEGDTVATVSWASRLHFLLSCKYCNKHFPARHFSVWRWCLMIFSDWRIVEEPTWQVIGKECWAHEKARPYLGFGGKIKCLQAVGPLAVHALMGGWEAARLPRVGCPLWPTVDCLLRGSKTGSEDSKKKYVKILNRSQNPAAPRGWLSRDKNVYP